MYMLTVGDAAPDFELPETSGGRIKLSDFRSKKNVVLYFYPRDDTSGCTKEACGFRDDLETIKSLDTEVIGVSSDSVESHKAFSQKFSLTFPLVSDTEKELAAKYGVPAMLVYKRVTFIINKEGKISHVFPEVNASTHSTQVIDSLKQLP